MSNSPHSHSVINPHPASGDFEAVVCDYCGSDTTEYLQSLQPLDQLPFPMHRLGASVLNDGGQAIDFVRCLNCGWVYMTPRPTETAIARFYDTVYAVPGAADPFESDQAERTRYLFAITARHLGDTNAPSLLDIGCGRGQFLRTAQAEGWTVYGSELSAVAAQAASTNLGGVSIHTGDFRDMGITPASLDVVSLLEVIEHLRAPVDYVRDAVNLLRPGGILLIEVPNVASWEYRAARALHQDYRGFTIEHLHYFTPDTMRNLLDDLCMDVVQMSSRHATTHWPNPIADIRVMLARPPAEPAPPTAAPEPAITPLPPLSLPERVMRQLNNYLMDVISALSQGPVDNPAPAGNTLYTWARKRP